MSLISSRRTQANDQRATLLSTRRDADCVHQFFIKFMSAVA